MKNRDRPGEAIAAYQRVIDDYGGDVEPLVRRQVALALYDLGMLQKDLGRSEAAVAAHQQVIHRYSDDANLRDVVELATRAVQS